MTLSVLIPITINIFAIFTIVIVFFIYIIKNNTNINLQFSVPFVAEIDIESSGSGYWLRMALAVLLNMPQQKITNNKAICVPRHRLNSQAQICASLVVNY